MIQRIQTVYLTLVVLLMFFATFFLNFVSDSQGSSIFTAADSVKVTFYISAIVALVSIFLYKKRINQFIVNRLNIILNLFLLGFFVYRSLTVSGESYLSQKGIGILAPFISIVLLFMANKAIKRDEDLVKSVDRLR